MKVPALVTVLSVGLLALSALGAHAQTAGSWPSKPVHLIVPFPAGGPTDIAARTVGQALSASMGVPFIIENKPGGRGFAGTADAARAQPDGYTLLVSSIGAMAINPRLYDKLPYDSNRDFAPVSLLVTVPIVVVVNPNVLPVDDVPSLVTFLRAHPGTVNFASAGSGGSNHLVPEYFKFRTGTFMTHIPYQGTAPAMNDLLAGNVHLMFDTLLNSTPFIKSGRLRLLAVTTAQRVPEFPDVPTVAEALGMKDFEASSWFAMYAPARTPADIVKRLSAEVATALKQPAVSRHLTELGAVPVGSTAEQLGTFQIAEQEKWGKVIQRAKIRPD